MEASAGVPDGITQMNDSLWELYSPPPPRKPEMEIIFFHGLQLGSFEHAFWKTWLAKGPDQVVWPREWLSKREIFSNARMLSVSYNSSATQTSGQLDMYKLGENLVTDIILQANVGQDCPVFLVGHSWGGIVIKQFVLAAIGERSIMELNRNASSVEIGKITKFYDNIRGLYYYSTPHLGSKLADLGRRLPGASPILGLLGTLNENTAVINSNFERQRKIPASTLVEGVDTTYGSWLGFGHLYKGRVVEPASARHGVDQHYTHTKANHFDVCKAESPNSTVIDKLAQFILRITLSEGVARIDDLPTPPSGSRQSAGTSKEPAAQLEERYSALKSSRAY